MEAWLNATDFVEELNFVNASHEHQNLCAVTGPNNTRLVRAALATDSQWADWHALLAKMPATSLLPPIDASAVDV